VMVLIGKNVKPGVIGGVAKGTTGAYAAADIDSATGAAQAGGDIPVAQTHVAAARTLGAALGIPEDVLTSDLTSDAGGKVVRTALV
jgi:hypothetical protein